MHHDVLSLLTGSAAAAADDDAVLAVMDEMHLKWNQLRLTAAVHGSYCVCMGCLRADRPVSSSQCRSPILCDGGISIKPHNEYSADL